jgi:hypothetical protein
VVLNPVSFLMATTRSLATRIRKRVIRRRLSQPHSPVPEPHLFEALELLFEREHFPQAIDKKHFRMELLEHLEAVNILFESAG